MTAMDDDSKRNIVRRFLDNLSEKELKLFADRLGYDLNDNLSAEELAEELARRFVFTRSRIREIEEKAFRNLRRKGGPHNAA